MKLDEYKDNQVLFYCASGGRSPSDVDTLANNGFKNIYHLRSVICSWIYILNKECSDKNPGERKIYEYRLYEI